MTQWTLALLAIAGCVAPGWHGSCGPWTDIGWHDPGLYRHIVGGPVPADWDAADGALPWSEEPWPGTRLARVSLELPAPAYQSRGSVAFSDPHIISVSLVREGVVELTTEGDVAEEEVQAVWTRFVANVTQAPDAEAWPAFRDSRQFAGATSAIPLEDGEFEERPWYTYYAPVPAPLRLEALAQEIALPSPELGGVGQATAAAGGWTFTFALPTWEVRFSEGDLKVDSADRAFFRTGAPSENEARGRALGALQSIGWTPSFEEVETVTAVC